VEPVINTGANLRTELERLEELHQLYKFRSDEVFRRVTIDNLVSLIIEVNKLEYQLRPSIREPAFESVANANGSAAPLAEKGGPSLHHSIIYKKYRTIYFRPSIILCFPRFNVIFRP
jgi:hypothetical protein